MKIAILSAMPEESAPLLEALGYQEKINFANNNYYITKYKNLDIVIAYSKIGKVFSTISACSLIQKFNCQMLLFSGVAGAINENLKIGDLIYADKLCQHDLDICAFGHPKGFVPEGSVFVKTNEKLNDIAKQVASQEKINIKKATIATGDQFVCDEKTKLQIKQIFNADAIEMEGASVAVACHALNVPCLLIRSISDSANKDASFDFDEFLEHSSKRSAKFIISILEKLNG